MFLYYCFAILIVILVLHIFDSLFSFLPLSCFLLLLTPIFDFVSIRQFSSCLISIRSFFIYLIVMFTNSFFLFFIFKPKPLLITHFSKLPPIVPIGSQLLPFAFYLNPIVKIIFAPRLTSIPTGIAIISKECLPS